MIKVLIVDDETIARINLRSLINWEREGCIICGESENGPDALKKIEALGPDIVFTDMNMPGMSGVEFIKEIRRISPAVKVVAFSAFDSFEYVRQSLKEGALDYLVKHKLDSSSLLSILNTIKDSIKKESMERQRINRMMEMATSGKALIQKNVLMNLLNGYIQGNFEAIMREYDICLEDKNLIVAAARIDNYYQLRDKFSDREFAGFLEAINSVLENACSENGKTVHVQMEDGCFVFIMSFAGTAGEAQINAKAVNSICNIEGAVKRFLNIRMSFGLSSICPTFSKIKDFYGEACTVLENGYYKGSNYIVQKNELVNRAKGQVFAGLSVAQEKNLISCIREVKKESTVEAIKEIFSNLRENKASYEHVKMVSIDLVNLLNRMGKEFGLDLNTVYLNNSRLYEEIKKYDSMEELQQWFNMLFSSLLGVLEISNIHAGHSPVIKKAIEFILNHYHKNISLSDVSEYVRVSPQYLSKLFREECKKGFVSYLNHVRIERAKRMLEEGVELKDLAQKLGFNSYTYFFTVFKENTGVTPQQYEKAVIARKKLETSSIGQ